MRKVTRLSALALGAIAAASKAQADSCQHLGGNDWHCYFDTTPGYCAELPWDPDYFCSVSCNNSGHIGNSYYHYCTEHGSYDTFTCHCKHS